MFTGHDGDHGRFLTAEGALALLAASDDVIEGWCWGYHIVRPDASSMAYLHELDVVEAHRRRGIGRRLVQGFMEMASSFAAFKMFLNTGLNNLGGRVAEQGEVVSHWFDLAPITGAPQEVSRRYPGLQVMKSLVDPPRRDPLGARQRTGLPTETASMRTNVRERDCGYRDNGGIRCDPLGSSGGCTDGSRRRGSSTHGVLGSRRWSARVRFRSPICACGWRSAAVSKRP